jgi:hypothetical protein
MTGQSPSAGRQDASGTSAGGIVLGGDRLVENRGVPVRVIDDLGASQDIGHPPADAS